MPLFKVTLTDTVTKTYEAYVEAPDQRAADQWASMVEDAATVGRCVGQERFDGDVGDIEPVETAPAGASVIQHTPAAVST